MTGIDLKHRKFCSEINEAQPEGVIAGWVQDTRNLGGIAFILVRDRTGVIQITALKK